MIKESKKLVRKASLQALVATQTGSSRFALATAELPQSARSLIVVLVATSTLAIHASYALAAQGGATKVIVNIITAITTFLSLLAGALAILFLVIGAIRIITAVKPEDKRKGYDNIKNAAIGLAVAIGAILIKVVIEAIAGQFVGAGGADSNEVGGP